MERSSYKSYVSGAVILFLVLCAGTMLLAGCGGGGGGGGGGATPGVRAWVETEPVTPGGTCSASLMISDPSGVAGLDLDLAFDPNLLSLSEVNMSALTTDFTMSYNAQIDGSLALSMARASGLTGGAGSEALLEMEFAVDQSAQAGGSLPISVNLAVYDEAPSRMSVQLEDGEIALQ